MGLMREQTMMLANCKKLLVDLSNGAAADFLA
jgi:hypothetical protein